MNAQVADTFVCINCGESGTTHAIGAKRAVRAGDAALCMQCGFLGVMTGNGMEHRKMSASEWDALSPSFQSDIEAIREQIIESRVERRATFNDLRDCLAVINANHLLLAWWQIKYL